MSFKSVAKGIAKSKGIPIERANAMLAAGTRRAMKKHGMSVKHGIPKNVWESPKPRGHSPLHTNPMEKGGEPCGSKFSR